MTWERHRIRAIEAENLIPSSVHRLSMAATRVSLFEALSAVIVLICAF